MDGLASGIALGDRVKDRITGLRGIVVDITFWLYACQRATVLPETAKDGKPAETFCVDVPQLERLREAVIVPPFPVWTEATPKAKAPRRGTGGPRPDPVRQPDPGRQSAIRNPQSAI